MGHFKEARSYTLILYYSFALQKIRSLTAVVVVSLSLQMASLVIIPSEPSMISSGRLQVPGSTSIGTSIDLFTSHCDSAPRPSILLAWCGHAIAHQTGPLSLSSITASTAPARQQRRPGRVGGRLRSKITTLAYWALLINSTMVSPSSPIGSSSSTSDCGDCSDCPYRPLRRPDRSLA
jgi:hypothetical protein